MVLRVFSAALALLILLAPAVGQETEQVDLPMPGKKWTGDLDGMIQQRAIRVLVAYSKTFFFIDKGTERGTACDAMKLFGDEINKKLKTGHLRVYMVFIPVTREELLPALVEGQGDIAVAGLTITPERLKQVDFTDPVAKGISEIVVTGPASPEVKKLDDLSGKEIFVRKSSSYYESLLKLNRGFRDRGKPEVVLRDAPENLEDEDLLEMVNAGMLGMVVVDSMLAEFWKQVLPDIRPHADVAVRTGGEIAWAIRKNSPKLKAELNALIKANGVGKAFGNIILRRYVRFSHLTLPCRA